MSIKMYVYQGPYLEYRITNNSATVDECRDPKHCPHPEPAKASEVYCSLCGIKNSCRIKVVNYPGFDLYDTVGDAFHELFSKDGVYVAIPNVGINGISREMHFGGYDQPDEALDMSDLNIEAEKAALEASLAEEIQLIRNGVGPQNLTVRWGLVIHFS